MRVMRGADGFPRLLHHEPRRTKRGHALLVMDCLGTSTQRDAREVTAK